MKYQDHHVKVDDLNVHYLSLGDSGKTIFFLHGWGGEAKNFQNLAEKIHQKTKYQVVLLDFPSFGLSDDPSEGWSSADYARFLTKFLEANFKTKAKYFYCHSFGGKVLCNALFSHSDLAKKIILSGSAGIVLPLTFRQRLARFLAFVTRPLRKLLPQKLSQRLGAKLSGARAWVDATPAQKKSLLLINAEKDFRHKLNLIKIPTLLLWGKGDTYTPLRCGEIFHEYLPDNQLHVFPDGRHGLHYTHIDAIVPLVRDFLTQ